MATRKRIAVSAALLCCLALTGWRELKGFPSVDASTFPDLFALSLKIGKYPRDFKLEREFCDKTPRHHCVYSMRSARISVTGIEGKDAVEIVSVECPSSCDVIDAVVSAALVLRTLSPGLADNDYVDWVGGINEDIAAQRMMKQYIGSVIMTMFPPRSTSNVKNLIFYLSSAEDR